MFRRLIGRESAGGPWRLALVQRRLVTQRNRKEEVGRAKAM
jgi:hypothetical protein